MSAENFPDTQRTEPKSLLTAQKQTREPTPEAPQNLAGGYRLFGSEKFLGRDVTKNSPSPADIPVFQPKIFPGIRPENFSGDGKNRRTTVSKIWERNVGQWDPRYGDPHRGVCPTALVPRSRVEIESVGGTVKPTGSIESFPKRTA